MGDKVECTSCHRLIDAQAKLCVYCNADPATGERFDPKPILEKHFPKRATVTPTERFLEFFRQRQALVVAGVAVALGLLLLGLYRVTVGHNSNVASTGVPLTDVADLSNREEESELPMPKMAFQYAGNPKTLRTFVLEPGAVTPPQAPDLSQETPHKPTSGTPVTPRVAAATESAPLLPRREPPQPLGIAPTFEPRLPPRLQGGFGTETTGTIPLPTETAVDTTTAT